MRFSLPGLSPPTWHGIITTDGGGLAGTGAFTMSPGLRFVAKVSLSFRNPATPVEATGFIGFIQDGSGGGLTPTVSAVTDPANLFPVFRVIGFQFDVRVATSWRYWTRGSSGVENILPTPASASRTVGGLQGPYYFVIETNKIHSSDSDSPIVKMGVYDGDKNLLDSITVTQDDLLPHPDARGLFTTVAIREEAFAPDPLNLMLSVANVILDAEADDFPPLP